MTTSNIPTCTKAESGPSAAIAAARSNTGGKCSSVDTSTTVTSAKNVAGGTAKRKERKIKGDSLRTLKSKA